MAPAAVDVVLGLEVVQLVEVPSVFRMGCVFSAHRCGDDGSTHPKPRLHLEGLRRPRVILCSIFQEDFLGGSPWGGARGGAGLRFFFRKFLWTLSLEGQVRRERRAWKFSHANGGGLLFVELAGSSFLYSQY